MKKRVLITGACGFIGHALVEDLLERTDYEIVCLDRLDIAGTLDRLKYIIDAYPSQAHRISFVFHDLKAEINEYTRNQIGNINYIFHLAAGSHVDRSIKFPMSFVMDNVVGTANLLDYARLHCPDLDLFYYFSTDEVFGPAQEEPYKEWDRYNSGNPYSASKAGAEELCVAYSNTYRIPMIITHCMNAFGQRQHKEKYIPICIDRIEKGEKIYIHANKDCTKAGSRFYIHTEDISDAVLFLLEKWNEGKLKFCDKYNIIGSQELDNFEVADLISKYMEKPLNYEFVDFHSDRPGHDLRYSLCDEKMKSLGWEPLPLTQRLHETIDWYLENKKWLK